MTPLPFTALATDYDGTLARHGEATFSTRAALQRFRAAGGVPLLVTGREIPDLQRVFDGMDLFDLIVAENGALLYWPATGRELLLGPAPEPQFIRELQSRGVTPLSIGRVIVATSEPHELDAADLIRELGLDRQVILNKGSVMVLPTGVDKATGLAAALDEVNLPASTVVGVGDAENDFPMLQYCGVGAAVQNAIPSLKASADLVLTRSHGAGVEELLERMLDGTIASVARRDRSALTALRARGQAPAARESHGSPLD